MRQTEQLVEFPLLPVAALGTAAMPVSPPGAGWLVMCDDGNTYASLNGAAYQLYDVGSGPSGWIHVGATIREQTLTDAVAIGAAAAPAAATKLFVAATVDPGVGDATLRVRAAALQTGAIFRCEDSAAAAVFTCSAAGAVACQSVAAVAGVTAATVAATGAVSGGSLAATAGNVTASVNVAAAQDVTAGRNVVAVATVQGLNVTATATCSGNQVASTFDVIAGRNVQAGDTASGLTVQATQALVTSGGFRIAASSPAAFAVDQNNYALGNDSNLRVSASAPVNWTGIQVAANADGRIVYICNVGANAITLLHLNAGSAAPARFFLTAGAAQVLAQFACIALKYDATSQVWRQISPVT